MEEHGTTQTEQTVYKPRRKLIDVGSIRQLRIHACG